MDKKLFAKLYDDECFRNFCGMVDELRKSGHEIAVPSETATLLFAAKVGCVEDDDIKVIHNRVKSFLDPDGRGISRTTSFYDYFVITSIMRIADGKREQLGGNRWGQLPLDLTEYANSICKFDTCTCGYKPKVLFSCFINSLTGKVTCGKCGLSVSKMFIYNELRPHEPVYDTYENLQAGIEKLSDLWNKEAAKNESILHRTMRELLSYAS